MSAIVMKEGAASATYDISALLAELGDVPVITDTQIVRKRSRDFFWYSPILNAELTGKSADVIVAPRNEATSSRRSEPVRGCAFPSRRAAELQAIMVRPFPWLAASCWI